MKTGEARAAVQSEQLDSAAIPGIISAIAEDMENDHAQQQKELRLKYENIIRDLNEQLRTKGNEGHLLSMIIDGSIVAHLKAAERTIKKVGGKIKNPDRELIISMLQSMVTELSNA